MANHIWKANRNAPYFPPQHYGGFWSEDPPFMYLSQIVKKNQIKKNLKKMTGLLCTWLDSTCSPLLLLRWLYSDGNAYNGYQTSYHYLHFFCIFSIIEYKLENKNLLPELNKRNMILFQFLFWDEKNSYYCIPNTPRYFNF